MTRYFNFYILIITVLLFASCEQPTPEKKESAFQNFYEQSEMAAIMVDMHDFLKEDRKRVLESKPLDDIPEYFDAIKTAEMGGNFNHNPFFSGFAEAFLKNMETLHTSESENKITQYNNAVNSCIACHTSGAACTGPIPRINKLLISTE